MMPSLLKQKNGWKKFSKVQQPDGYFGPRIVETDHQDNKGRNTRPLAKYVDALDDAIIL
jgi:hypothetical protein